MPTSQFPNQELQSWFEDLENSISQDGCSDDLAVCDQRPLVDLHTHRHLFNDVNTKILILSLYNSMSNEGCEYPFAVVDYQDFTSLQEHLTQ
jgi:hypothetical protein